MCQVFTDGMIRTVVRDLPNGDGVVFQGERAVALLNVGDDLVVVGVALELGRVLPGHGSDVIPNLYAV